MGYVHHGLGIEIAPSANSFLTIARFKTAWYSYRAFLIGYRLNIAVRLERKPSHRLCDFFWNGLGEVCPQ
jgi:hypothetical protein